MRDSVYTSFSQHLFSLHFRIDGSRYDNCVLSGAQAYNSYYGGGGGYNNNAFVGGDFETKRDWSVYQIDKRCSGGSGGGGCKLKQAIKYTTVIAVNIFSLQKSFLLCSCSMTNAYDKVNCLKVA